MEEDRDRLAEHIAGREPYHMTPEQIAPHQVPVHSVTFIRESQEITGDTWRSYRAPDGEVCEVRVKCGAYAPDQPAWTDEQASEYAVAQLNERRQGRAGRIERGLPVTAQLKATGE
jgi:hypothetical protein